MKTDLIQQGYTIGTYRVVSLIGTGGMGAVYRAVQERLNAPVALKVIRSNLENYQDAVGRFEREARQIAQLRGRTQHVVQIYDFGRDDVAGLYYIAMELVDGEGLDRVVGRLGRVSEDRAVRLIRQAARGIEVAHGLGIVHRDIKPENLLLGHGGVVKVSDFGLARCSDSATKMTATGAMLGTPAYMTPEQVRGDRADERSDIYSLGGTLYFLVTGQTPYQSESAFAMAVHQLTSPVPDALAAGAEISSQLNALIVKAMAKDPAERFGSATELIAALDEVLALDPEAAARPDEQVLMPLVPRPSYGVTAIGPGFAAAPLPAPAPGPRDLPRDALETVAAWSSAVDDPGSGTVYPASGPKIDAVVPAPVRRPASVRRTAGVIVSHVLVALVAVAATFFVACYIGRAALLAGLREEIRTVAAEWAGQIDGDLLASIAKPEQEDGPEYREIWGTLHAIRRANPSIKFIYTVRRGEQPGIVEFVVDEQVTADTNGNGMIDPEEERAHVGETYNASLLAPRMLEGFDGPAVEDGEEEDRWGRAIAGYAPIRDGGGRVVAVLGVDYRTDRLQALPGALGRAAGIAALFAALFGALAGIWQARRRILPLAAERDRLREALDRFAAPGLSAEALATPGSSSSATRRRVTVACVGVQGLTARAEESAPEQVMELIDDCFTRMSSVVAGRGGTVTRFLHDGLMAHFGTESEPTSQEENAVAAALELAATLDGFAAARGLRAMNLMVGIHTGMVHLGSIGSRHHTEIAALGSTVSLASGLQGACALLGVRVLVSAPTMDIARSRFTCRRIEGIQVDGVAEPVTAWAVDGFRGSGAGARPAPGEQA